MCRVIRCAKFMGFLASLGTLHCARGVEPEPPAQTRSNIERIPVSGSGVFFDGCLARGPFAERLARSVAASDRALVRGRVLAYREGRGTWAFGERSTGIVEYETAVSQILITQVLTNTSEAGLARATRGVVSVYEVLPSRARLTDSQGNQYISADRAAHPSERLLPGDLATTSLFVLEFGGAGIRVVRRLQDGGDRVSAEDEQESLLLASVLDALGRIRAQGVVE